MKKASSKCLRTLIAGFLLMLFFIVASAFSTPLNENEYLEYLGYPPALSSIILKQDKVSRLFFLDHAYNPDLEELYFGLLFDGAIKENEIKLIHLIQDVYPLQSLTFFEADFFRNLLYVFQWETFFDYAIPFYLFDEIEVNGKMMELNEEAFYPVEVPYVPVITYHMVDDSRYWINQHSFRWQLEQLAESGFSTIRADAFFSGDFSSVPEGRKPVLLTFDDGWESQFRFLAHHNPDPLSGVGILNSVAKKYPEFGNHAVFYVYFSIIPFGETQHPGRWREKLKYLQDHGYEIGNHTYDHQIMTNFTPEQITDNLDKFYQTLEKIPEIDISKVMTLAYPGGYIPTHREYIENYEYKGLPLSGAFTAWGGKALMPLHPDADIYCLPRYDGTNENIRKLIQEDLYKKQTQFMQLPEMFTNSIQLMKYYLSQHTDLHQHRLIWRGYWIENSQIMEDL